jgi:septal ring factor EnvC (AmiA/AmiB activator)
MPDNENLNHQKAATDGAATQKDIKDLKDLILSSFDVFSSFQEELKTINISIRSLNQKVHDLESDSRAGRERLEKKMKDLESDSRTDKALLRAAQQMGFGFRGKTPYELQGNAAIEDIKEYY